MRKILFLAMFILASLTVLFADEATESLKIERPGLVKPIPLGSTVNAQAIHGQVSETESKSFNIGYHGIIKIMPMGSVLNVQIIYDQISEAPQPVQENMEYDLETGKTRTIKYRFNVKLFDRGGYLVCKQPCFFKDFVLDKTGQHPKIMMSYQTQGCGINSYEKIASAVVDYNN